MKILVVGGHGTIGKKIVAHFSDEHEIFIAGRKKGDLIIDIASRIGAAKASSITSR